MTVTILQEIKEVEGATRLPKLGDKVVVHYSGWLARKPDGEPFDSSREKGHAFTFAVGVGKVIEGWDAAVQAMPKGARRKVHISSDEAYGPRGRPPVIGPNEDLIFDIEVLNINETLVEEGMRVRREEAERVERFLKLQDAEKAAASGAAPSKQRERDARSSSGSDSGSSSSSDSEERRRRKREKKERKREKKERKREKKEKKEKKRKRDKDDKKRKDKDDKHKKRRRDSDSS